MVPGDFLGISFPTSIEELLAQGPAFLTEAFRAAGALAAGNRIVEITNWREVVLGGMGRKLEITVTYEHADKNLHTDLFIKFPRDFGDPLRDVFGPWMAPEIRFALLSRQPEFPITVPKCYFADFHAESLSGLLITERIAYGQDGIEPCPAKSADYELSDALPRYQAITRAMARLAAHHRLGRFGDSIEREFPIAAADGPDEHEPALTADTLCEKMDELRAFAERYPQLFCDGLGDADFLRSISEEAQLVLKFGPAIHRYIQNQSDYVGLCHPNLNLDNAWFWNDGTGALQVGLLDWGNVGQMNFAHAIIGMICCAETAFVRAHRDQLIREFADEFERHAGLQLDAGKLAYLVKLSMPLLSVPWIVDIPPLLERLMPDLASVQDRFDPRIRDDVVIRSQLQGLMVILSEWRDCDFGGMLRALAAGQTIDSLAGGGQPNSDS